MSMAVLHQVFQETRRLAIAGSNLAPGDFRLKKLVPALEKSGKKAPVFAKVADAANRLLEAKPKEASAALLDLSALVMAILYTQGETGAKGTLKPIKPAGIQLSSTQTPARTIKPLIEALTSTGSGRLELIKEAHERKAFEDPRLVNQAIASLDDVYGELADFMEENVVVGYGASIVPMIEDNIDIKGRGGHVRRLRLLHRFAPEKARPIVLEAFEKGSKEMRIAALGCLGDSKEDLPHLVEQVGSKSKDVRAVAYQRIVLFDTPEVVDLLDNALDGKDAGIAAAGIVESKSKKLLTKVVAKLKVAVDELLAVEPKKKKTAADRKAIDALIARAETLFYSLTHRDEATVEKQVTTIIDNREHLNFVKGKDQCADSLVDAAAWWIVRVGKKPHRMQLAELHGEGKEDFFYACVESAILSFPPKRFYDEFKPYCESKQRNTKRRRRQAVQKEEVVLETVLEFAGENPLYGYSIHHWRWHHHHVAKDAPKVTLDPRWLSDAVEAKDAEMAMQLVSAKDKAAIAFLVSEAKKELGAKEVGWELDRILGVLLECQAKEAVDLVIQSLQHHSDRLKKAKTRRYYYGGYYSGSALGNLSAPQLKKIEQALEGLHEQVIDQTMPYLQQAKDTKKKK